MSGTPRNTLPARPAIHPLRASRDSSAQDAEDSLVSAHAVFARIPLDSPEALWADFLDTNTYTHPAAAPPRNLPYLPQIFETPADLLCPITHCLFVDPVINACGQVYERSAIVAHLRAQQQQQQQGSGGAAAVVPTDPLTNAPLPSTSLTPVYPMRSRAAELREKVAKACVQRACSVDCRDPVRYLRRAAEVLSDVDGSIRVPGLGSEVVGYVQSHASAAYDHKALQLFAAGLRSCGYVDQAANVHYRLFQLAADRSQQAEALKQCLACWAAADWPADYWAAAAAAGSADAAAAASSSSSYPSASAQQPSSSSSSHSREVLPKLAAFVDNVQETFGVGQIVDMLREENEQLALELCEYLLSGGGAAAGGGGGGGGMQGCSSGSFSMAAGDVGSTVADRRYRELLFKYVQIKTSRAALQTHPAAGRASGGASRGTLGAAGGSGGGGSRATAASGSKAVTRGGWVRQRAVQAVGKHRHWLASGIFVAASLVHAQHFVATVARTGSLLFMIHDRRRHG